MSKHWFTCMARNKSLSWLLSNALHVGAGYWEDRQFVKRYVRLSLACVASFFCYQRVCGKSKHTHVHRDQREAVAKFLPFLIFAKAVHLHALRCFAKKAVSLVWGRPTRCLQGHSRRFVKCYFCPPFLSISNPLLLLSQTNKYVLRCKWCDIQINPKHC